MAAVTSRPGASLDDNDSLEEGVDKTRKDEDNAGAALEAEARLATGGGKAAARAAGPAAAAAAANA